MSHLCCQFALPKSLSVAKLCINVMSYGPCYVYYIILFLSSDIWNKVNVTFMLPVCLTKVIKCCQAVYYCHELWPLSCILYIVCFILQIFGIKLMSHLCCQFALPKSLSVAKLCINVMFAMVGGRSHT